MVNRLHDFASHLILNGGNANLGRRSTSHRGIPLTSRTEAPLRIELGQATAS
jgi:hypothetical protein